MSVTQNGVDSVESSSSSESLLTVEHVKCRSHGGALGKVQIFQDRIVWSDYDQKIDVTHRYEDIRTQRVSPANKPRVQLQLCPLTGDPSTLHFVNPGGNETQMKERETVKDMVQQLLNSVRRQQKHNNTNNNSVEKHLQEKKRILHENETLRNLYRDLVATGIVTAQEFWNDYASQTKTTTAPVSQNIGTSPGFLSNLSTADGCNGIKVNLSADVMQSVFKTYPAVERKHVELVPHEMSEREFWTKFLQSHYFHRERTLTLDPKDVFADCLRLDDADLQTMVKTGSQNDRVNLDKLIEEPTIKGDEDQPTSSKAALIRQFNYHSSRVLRSCLSDRQDGAPKSIGASLPQTSHSSQPPNKKLRLESLAVRDSFELGEEQGTEPVSLNLTQTTKKISAHFDKEHAKKLGNCLTRAMNDAHRLQPGIDVSAAQTVLQEFTHNLTDAADLNKSVSKKSLSELHDLNIALTELLRHFWCCFPANTADLEKKVEKMVETLQRFEKERLKVAYQKSQAPNKNALFEHLFRMLKAAFDKHKSWSSRRK